MFNCSSCHQSRWVHVRFEALAEDLEWLTGWTPYWCQACGRRGWYHSRPTPPAFEKLRPLFPRLSLARLSPGRAAWKAWRHRFPIAMLKGRFPGPARGPVFAFALGLWVGALVFSGPTGGADRESLAAADDVAPKQIAGPADAPPSVDFLGSVTALVAGVGPVVTPAGEDLRAEGTPPPIREVRAAVTPPTGSVRPAVTPPVANGRKAVLPPVKNLPPAVTPTSGDQGVRFPMTGSPDDPIPPAAPKPVTRLATARDQREPQRTAAPVKPAPRAPQSDAPKSAVRAVVAASKLPRFHGSLAIRSEPGGALVSVDGQVVGPTPLLLKGIRAGSRVVRIESEGYERWSSATRVVANQKTAIVATLQRN